MKTLRLIVGIISIVLVLVIMLQSCAAGVGNLLSDSEEFSGFAGFILSICFLIAGIVGISTRNNERAGGPITSIVFYIIGGLVGIVNYGSFADLQIWSILSFIFAFLFLVSIIFNSSKKSEQVSAVKQEIMSADLSNKVEPVKKNAVPLQTGLKKIIRPIIYIIIVIVGILILIILYVIIKGDSEPSVTIAENPDAIYTEIASTVLAGMTQTAASDPGAIYTQVAATILAQGYSEETTSTEAIEPTVEPEQDTTSEISFSDGTYQVGTHIQPGMYRTNGTSFCYWERLSGFGGTFDEIMANENLSGPGVVSILPSDAGFSSSGCGNWVLQTEQITAGIIPQTSFGDGVWRIGIDIQAGTYTTDGSSSSNCYWERLSGFEGTFNEIIANENVAGPAVITILPSDVGFSSSGCGTWVLQQ